MSRKNACNKNVIEMANIPDFVLLFICLKQVGERGGDVRKKRCVAAVLEAVIVQGVFREP